MDDAPAGHASGPGHDDQRRARRSVDRAAHRSAPEVLDWKAPKVPKVAPKVKVVKPAPRVVYIAAEQPAAQASAAAAPADEAPAARGDDDRGDDDHGDRHGDDDHGQEGDD